MTERQLPVRQRSSALARHIGVVARSGAWTASGRRVGLRHVAPWLTGCWVPPWTAVSRPSSPVATSPQPTPQYGHVVRVSGKPHPDLAVALLDLVDGDALRPVEGLAAREIEAAP